MEGIELIEEISTLKEDLKRIDNDLLNLNNVLSRSHQKPTVNGVIISSLSMHELRTAMEQFLVNKKIIIMKDLEKYKITKQEN